MIKNLQTILSAKSLFNVYTKNDLGLAVYTKIII